MYSIKNLAELNQHLYNLRSPITSRTSMNGINLEQILSSSKLHCTDSLSTLFIEMCYIKVLQLKIKVADNCGSPDLHVSVVESIKTDVATAGEYSSLATRQATKNRSNDF